MPKQTKSGLPLGVTERKNRPGLYQMRVMVGGRRYSEDYRAVETTKKKLQSELQKAIDAFKERVERGQLKSGDISDKSTFAQAVEWFIGVRKLEIRESTQLAENFIFEHYLVPRLGRFKLKEITVPMVSKLLAELLEKGGGGKAAYTARPEFIEFMRSKKPSRKEGGFNQIARDLDVSSHTTFHRACRGERCAKKIADKVANYFDTPFSAAFVKITEAKPLSAEYVRKITVTLSALFSACVKNGILTQNPVVNATKPRIGEKDIPAYLDNTQIPIFLDALNNLDIDNSVRVAITLMLMLGLRSGEARGLRWIDIDFQDNIISVEKNCGKTLNGLSLTELKTKRSRRKLPLSPALQGILLEQKQVQEEYARTLCSMWQDNGLVCPNTRGGYMAGSAPNEAVKRVVSERQELPRDLHAHSMRHSFISLLIFSGYDPVSVAALAGDTIEIISKHYAHSFAERRAAAMDKVGMIFAQMNLSPALPCLPAVGQ